ncbi:MAG: hypothetical protein CMI23_03710 [Opitutae bacterium]|nr:hypothetical protein [Opitutae bacterium]
MINNKALRIFYANYRALKHKFLFCRTKNFSIPKSISIRGVRRPISASNDATKIFMEIFLYDEYFLRKITNEAIQTIVDIGANVGIFSITARSFFQSAKIYSYEPSSNAFSFLKKNGEEFGFKSFCAAVGSQTCFGKLIEEGSSGCLSKFIATETGNDEMISFENIFDHNSISNLDLIKIDCEGCEYELLAKSNMWSKVKFLTMEFHENDLDSISKILSKINFEILYSFTYPFYTGIVLAKNLAFSKK